MNVHQSIFALATAGSLLYVTPAMAAIPPIVNGPAHPIVRASVTLPVATPAPATCKLAMTSATGTQAVAIYAYRFNSNGGAAGSATITAPATSGTIGIFSALASPPVAIKTAMLSCPSSYAELLNDTVSAITKPVAPGTTLTVTINYGSRLTAKPTTGGHPAGR